MAHNFIMARGEDYYFKISTGEPRSAPNQGKENVCKREICSEEKVRVFSTYVQKRRKFRKGGGKATRVNISKGRSVCREKEKL